jgi:penicillin-binding protein 1A
MEGLTPPPRPAPARQARLLAARLRGLIERASGRQLAALALAVLFFLALLFGFAWQHCFFDGCPDVGRLAAYQPDSAPVLLDRYGRPFADLTPLARRVVPLHRLPQHVAQAFLAVEDRRFFEHSGVDWRRVAGATLANLRAGSFEEGFSTLSMQLARNVFPDRLPGQERSARRKLLEIRVAQEIEARFAKDEILELYLNNIYFGGGARGVEAASRRSFAVPAERLTLPQAALLAALPKAPTRYDPRRYPGRALERRNLVLTLMEQQGRIPARVAAEARQEPLGLVRGREEEEEPGFAPYFVAEVRRELEEAFGDGLYERPLLVRTTLDRDVQRAAEQELERQLRAIEGGGLGRFDGPRPGGPGAFRADGSPAYLQGAAVVMEVTSGDVLAWVGGRDYADSQFDRVARARRQAGSAFKPFVYAAALAAGHALSEPLADRPLVVRFRDGRVWRPRNFTGRYDGEVTVRDALVRSKNVATVRLADAVGMAEVAALARRAGIARPVPELPSSALGTVAVSPLELTTAYTAFAGLGTAVEPRLVREVRRLDGRLVWRPPVARRRVIDPGVAYLIDDALSDALTRGSGAPVRQAGFRAEAAAGKTCTTNEGADAWFVGYTPRHAAGVWIGFDRPRPIAEQATGGGLAAPVWGRLMQRLYSKYPPPAPWPRPQGVVELPVDPRSGFPLAEQCRPRGEGTPAELFLADRAPDPVCPGVGPRPQWRIARARVDDEEEAPPKAPAPQVARVAPPPAKAPPAAVPGPAERIVAKTPPPAAPQPDRIAERRSAARRAADERAERAKREEERRAAAERAAADRAVERARAERRAREEREARIEEREVQEEERSAEERAGLDLTGWWDVTNVIESTSYPAYEGLALGYRVYLEQRGDRIVGHGTKRSEDGRPLSGGARTPISISGSLDGGTARLLFTERGTRRTSTGSFRWKVRDGGDTLRGSFASGAADSSGPSVARRSG